MESAAAAIANSPRAAFFFLEPLFYVTGKRSGASAFQLSDIRRVLIVRPDEIGDVVMTSPFLRELRKNLPNALITVVVKESLRNYLETCPYVNEVLSYDTSIQGRLAPLRRYGRILRLGRRDLWKRSFDLAIVPRFDTDYYHGGFLAYFSGARRRAGYSEQVSDRKREYNTGWDRLYSHLLDDRSLKHETQKSLDLISFLGGVVQDGRLEVWAAPEDEAFVDEYFSSRGIPNGEKTVAFGIGTNSPNRMWSASNFAQLGKWLSERFDSHIVILGSQEEEQIGREVKTRIGDRAFNLAGKTTLRQAGAILSRCRLFVGNDSGPMHLAAAAGAPVVEISCHPKSGSPFHWNSPARVGPWGKGHIILQPEKALDSCSASEGCEANFAHCILQISVEQVREAVKQIL